MDVNTVILSGMISFITAIITACVTAKLAIKSNKKKVVHENRVALYCGVSQETDKLLMDRSLSFESEFADILTSYKPKIKLYGSAKVVKDYREIVCLVHQVQKEYEQFKSECNPWNDENNYVLDYNDEEQEEYDRYIGTEEMECSFKQQCERYRKENMPPLSTVQELMDKLHKSMRKDIGSER